MIVALRLVVLLALILGFGSARAQLQDDAMLLVAHPGFRDMDYRNTVLLAAPVVNGGHVGVILNRPTRRSLGSLFPEHEPITSGGGQPPIPCRRRETMIRLQRQPIGRRCDDLAALLPRIARHYDEHTVQAQHLSRIDRRDDVPYVHRIEGATEHAHALGPVGHQESVRARWIHTSYTRPSHFGPTLCP